MDQNLDALPSTSLGRALDIFSLFSLARPMIRVEDVMESFGYSQSTAYRYVKELCDTGLLSPSSNASYALGPRIIELERLLVLTDPLYLAGQEVLPPLQRDDAVLLLHNLYRDKVLCVLNVGPHTLHHGGRRITVGRARGLPFSLFSGAGSLALLAFLPQPYIRQAYLQHGREIAQAGLGEDWNAYRKKLAAIRRAGYAVSLGQVTPWLAGIAAPILLPAEKRVIGSVALAFPLERLDRQREAESAAELASISSRLAEAYLRRTR